VHTTFIEDAVRERKENGKRTPAEVVIAGLGVNVNVGVFCADYPEGLENRV